MAPSFRYALLSDIGRKRSQNQDNGAARPELGLFVVADGMGGHRGGEIASAMAAELIPQYVAEAQKSSDWDPAECVREAVRVANYQINQRALRESTLQGMGTTTTALLFKGDKLYIGHVGDSRCYFVKDGNIWQLTRDHSLVQEKLRAGLITREQLKTDRMKNVITRSVGFEPDVQVDVYQMAVSPGDAFVICSDGLSGPVSEGEILKILEDELLSPKAAAAHTGDDGIPPAPSASDAAATTNTAEAEVAARKLIERANAAGGDDNITAVVVQVR